MSGFYVIDAHVHTYRTPEIGYQALSGWNAVGCCGTPEELVPIMKEAGISLAVQVNNTPARSMFDAALAGLPEEERDSAREGLREKITGRVRRRNEWTSQMAREHPELIPFMSVDPIMGPAAVMDELKDKIENFGARGLKIHPGEGRFSMDDPILRPVFETIERLGVPVISHGGIEMTDPDQEFTRPRAFAGLLERFPDLTVVIAHLGNGYLDESVEMARKYPNLYFDTSAMISGAEDGSSLLGDGSRLLVDRPPLSDDEAVDLIRRIGVDRVMFGSDYPWFHPGWDLKRFLGLKFDDREKKALLAGNAQRILKL